MGRSRCDELGSLDAVHPWHLDVHDGQVRRGGPRQRDGFLACGGLGYHLMTQRVELRSQAQQADTFIIGEQHS